MTGAAIVVAILELWPHAQWRQCIVEHRTEIASRLDAAEADYGIPVELVAAVAWQESWLGCNPRARGGWGVPGGSPDDAVRALASAYRVAGSYDGVVYRFHTGVVDPARGTRAFHAARFYRSQVRRIARRIAPRFVWRMPRSRPSC